MSADLLSNMHRPLSHSGIETLCAFKLIKPHQVRSGPGLIPGNIYVMEDEVDLKLEIIPLQRRAFSHSPRNHPVQVIRILKTRFSGLRAHGIREVRYALQSINRRANRQTTIFAGTKNQDV